MFYRILEWTAAAALAMTSVPTLASEPTCTASVCREDGWPAMKTAAPPIVLDQHFSTKVIGEMVANHVTTDDSVTEHEETVHLHQYASLATVMEQAEEP